MTEATTDTRSLDEMTLFDPQILKCPYHYDRSLREQAPVYQDPASGVYIVATYDLVREAHRAKDIFSNEFGLAVGAAMEVAPEVRAVADTTYNLGKGTLLTIDDPEHKVFRDAVKDWFTAEHFQTYEPWIRRRTRELLDGLAAKSECSLVEEFARPLPLSVIMHVLGMPPELFDKAFKWTVDNVTVLSQVADTASLVEANKGLKEEYDWFVQALDARRGRPVADLLGVISNSKYADRPCTTEEQLSYCTQFLVAGNETTTATLAECMRQLCLNPDQMEAVRNDRSLIPNMVEESLRLATPTSNMWRYMKEDYELGGVLIPKGAMVLLKYFSSNHDESLFEEPGKFDVTRQNARRHIAFGFGTHVCIGQHLSKLEMNVAWEEIFDRLDDLQLACAAEELEYMPNILLRGLEEIPIRYTAR
jgi:cytochrome P450 family 142 subfamily A polypeptide 1